MNVSRNHTPLLVRKARPSSARTGRLAIAATATLASLPLLLSGGARAQTGGAIYDLGTLGGSSGKAFGICNNKIVGWSNNAAGTRRGTAWTFSAFSPYAPVPSLVQELPPINGYTTSWANGISANGRRLVGASGTTGGIRHATVWDFDTGHSYGGTIPFEAYDIHPPDGYDTSEAFATNSYSYTYPSYPFVLPQSGKTSYGTIVGGTFSSTSDAAQPFGGTLWNPDPGVIVSQTSYPSSSDSGRLANAVAYGIAGQAYQGAFPSVGYMWNPLGPPRAYCVYTVSQRVPAYSNNIVTYNLWDQCVPNVDSVATGILPEGTATGTKVVCGYMGTGSNERAFIWTKVGGPTTPGTLPAPGSPPVLTTLPTLGGATEAYNIKHSISGNTVMVFGHSVTTAGQSHAFVYYGGTMQDLNNLLPPGSGWVLTEARDGIEINAGTWIVVGEGSHIVNGVTQPQRPFMFLISGVPS